MIGELPVAQRHGAWRDAQEQSVTLGKRSRALRDSGAQSPADAVAGHGITDPAADRVSTGGVACIIELGTLERERTGRTSRRAPQLRELGGAVHRRDHAERLWRPLSLRDLSTARP